MKKIKGSLLVAFLLTMLGALLVGGATVAWFTSEAENNNNTFASGTLKISLDKLDGTKYFDISNIQPGDSGSANITVKNDGSLKLRYDFHLTKAGGLFEEPTPLVITIRKNNQVVEPSTKRELAPGDEETFTFSWSMPEGAGNSYQGQTGTLGIGVYAEQTTAP